MEITEILQERHNTEIWECSLKNKTQIGWLILFKSLITLLVCLRRIKMFLFSIFYDYRWSLWSHIHHFLWLLDFPFTILNIWNNEKQCYYDKLLGTFLEQGMVSCFLRGDLKFLRFFKTIFHCYSPWLLITRIKYK